MSRNSTPIRHVRGAGDVLASDNPTTPPTMAVRRSPRLQTHLSPVIPSFLQGIVPVPIPMSTEANINVTTSRSSSCRTHEAIVLARGCDLPPNWPCGPWTSRYQARDDLKTHFQCLGFGVRLDSHKQPTSKKGEVCNLFCSKKNPPKPAMTTEKARGSEGTLCRWYITLEEAVEGWVISKLNNLTHNHATTTTVTERLASATLRSIPKEFIAFGEFLKQTGMSPVEILKYGLLLPLFCFYEHVLVACSSIYVHHQFVHPIIECYI